MTTPRARKHQRTDAAFARLGEVFAAAKPDVMVVFGDDQKEQFDLRNFPAFAVYVGGAFTGYKELSYEGVPGASRVTKPKTPEHWTEVSTRPELAKAVLDGSWKPDDVWWGFKEGLLGMAPYNKALPENVRAAAEKIVADTKAGTYEVFTGPIADQSGKERVAKGQRMDDKDLLVMDWYVKGVQS